MTGPPPAPPAPAALAALAEDDRRRLLALARETAFGAGSRLFEEGDPADRFWLIRTGQVALDTYVPGRRAAVVETLGPGQLLGWSWLYPPYRWHLGAVAVEAVDAWEFPAGEVRELCEAEPVLGYALMSHCARMAVERLQAARIRLLDLYAPRGGGPP